MKKTIILLIILSILSIITVQLQQYVLAVTMGIEPPAAYMNNLKTCTPGTFNDKQSSMVMEYSIKGLLSTGRCDVIITSYTDFSDPEDYKTAKEMLGGFIGMAESMAKESGQEFDKSAIPSTDEILKMAQNEKYIVHCKFSQVERNELYSAWQKHDGKNKPAQKTANGGYSFSWDSSKMSSYENLMFKLSQGPCENYSSSEEQSTSKSKKYACEYADTTCYWTSFGENSNGGMMQCTKENPNADTFKVMDKVKEHVKAGYCEQI